jgi:hypothetical protein
MWVVMFLPFGDTWSGDLVIFWLSYWGVGLLTSSIGFVGSFGEVSPDILTKTKCSKRTELQLTSMDFFSCNTLTWIPQGNLSRKKEREWESSRKACEAI